MKNSVLNFLSGKRLVEYPLVIKVYEGSEADLRMRECLKQANQYKIHINIERT